MASKERVNPQINYSKIEDVQGVKKVSGISKQSDDVPQIKEVQYGKHIIKGKNGKKKLLSNSKYATEVGYNYKTGSLGRIKNVEVDKLEYGAAKRNPYAQRSVGGSDRLPTDDGGHLIASQFRGSGDIDNLLPQSKNINRSGGDWYSMEQEWANTIKDNKSVRNVQIDIGYPGNSKRPDMFKVSYNIDGKLPIRRIKNE
ncbi:DNA/RNA non-specific endonuclease [Sporolactobacillus sp. CQH2019]|uniref:DNA/RNA non-specific endonuclease n=1 Tax=Sporolactobacillus sp. CQH2019 TaxID=3023512 RepID=UPI00236755C9|nr:DNA/RNA non-specific endonuclease [Sporolactobacillus sp. CQH2019]MDD9149979.1 DNA/RNA non-specific endonuclease [Sporolactobacillus sp. CQH2019]